MLAAAAQGGHSAGETCVRRGQGALSAAGCALPTWRRCIPCTGVVGITHTLTAVAAAGARRRRAGKGSANPFVRAALAELRAAAPGAPRAPRAAPPGRQGAESMAEAAPGVPGVPPLPAPAPGVPSSSEDEEDGYSDLDDFIVCRPGRDYGRLFSAEFAYRGKRGGAGAHPT
jgi:hypothetical protein